MKTLVKGKIAAIFDKKEGVSKTSGKSWASQDFAIQDEDNEVLVFNVFGAENIAQYGLTVGAEVLVELSITSREYNGKYFTQVRCLNCSRTSGGQGEQVQPASAPAQTNANTVGAPTSISDLPF